MSGPGLVAELKERWPILEVVELIGLADTRKGMKILCPAHADTNPSCHLYLDQDRWQCFACGQGGDQLDLFATSQGLPLAQAIASLATESGIDYRDRDWGDVRQREPSPAEQLFNVESKAQYEVLKAMERDYPEFWGKEAWCSLMEAAFSHHDEIMRRYRNRELKPDQAIELLLTWWKWMTGQRAYSQDMLSLFTVIGDARLWTEITGKEVGDGQPQPQPGDKRRGESGAHRERGRLPGPADAQPRPQRPGRRRDLAPHPRPDQGEREGRGAAEHGGRAGAGRRSLRPGP
jgi:CHC2 zinc finger